MRTIRSVAVGMGLSAFFIVALYERFANLSGGWQIWSIIANLSYRSSNISETLESHTVFTAVYLLICLGLGLFIGSFYGRLEGFLTDGKRNYAPVSAGGIIEDLPPMPNSFSPTEMIKQNALVLALLFVMALPIFCFAEDAIVITFPTGDTAAVMVSGKVVPIRMTGVVVDGTSIYRQDPRLNGTEKRLKEFLAKTAPRGSRIRLEFDSQQADPVIQNYLAGYIWLPNGKMLNEEIIKAGLAIPANEGKYVDRFVKAFDRAY